MNTTELIELLKSVEFGASGRPREISISYNSGEIYFPEPDISISGTGDGVAGAELSLELTGEVWAEELEEVDRAYKDGYEKGKQHATEKQSEETETVASVFVDFLIASAKLKMALGMEVEELEE